MNGYFGVRVSGNISCRVIAKDSTAQDRYQFFVPELLVTEGLNGFQVAQLTDITASFLQHYDTVILPHFTLNSGQVALLQDYVNAGGTLIGFRPDAQLAAVFGVSPLGSAIPEAWLQIQPGTPQGYGLTNQVLRYHGTADRYALNGASSLPTLYQNPTTSLSAPAAAINSFGQGQARSFQL